MSFDLCRPTDRGSLTDLGAKNGGLDLSLLATGTEGNFQSDQEFEKYGNFARDTSIRTPMEGQRNKYSAVVPEQGDLLDSATLVIRHINHESLSGTGFTSDLIDNIEIRINGQCIQRLDKDDLDVPFGPVNGPTTYYQGSGYRALSSQTTGPWYIPINAFFSKDGNSYPLIDSQYPMEIHVTFNSMDCLTDADVTVGGQPFRPLGCNDWHQMYELTLMTAQVYLSKEERDFIRNKERDMYVVQRDIQRVPLANHTDMRIKLDSNLPLRSIQINDSPEQVKANNARIAGNTLVRFLINREPRFEHFFKYLQYCGETAGFDVHLRTRLDDQLKTWGKYYFGDPEYSPYGRCNLSMLDDPTIEIHGLEAGTDGEIMIRTESYNLLRWKDGKAYLVLHKSR